MADRNVDLTSSVIYNNSKLFEQFSLQRSHVFHFQSRTFKRVTRWMCSAIYDDVCHLRGRWTTVITKQ